MSVPSGNYLEPSYAAAGWLYDLSVVRTSTGLASPRGTVIELLLLFVHKAAPASMDI